MTKVAPATLIELASSSGEHSAPVTHVLERIVLTVLVLAVFGGLCRLMWHGYQRRAGRQADVPQPASAAPTPVADGEGAEGIYGSTTTHGDWLDRIAVHGLGVRSNARLSVTDEGVFFAREGAPDLFIPAADLIGAELAPGVAGKVTGGEGVVLVTWRLGERTVDTGFHPRAKAVREGLVEAINQLSGNKGEKQEANA
jgi:hypothetical protein